MVVGAPIRLVTYGSCGELRWLPYPLWPEEGGLLQWGKRADEKTLFCLTRGEPSEWPVVVAREP